MKTQRIELDRNNVWSSSPSRNNRVARGMHVCITQNATTVFYSDMVYIWTNIMLFSFICFDNLTRCLLHSLLHAVHY